MKIRNLGNDTTMHMVQTSPALASLLLALGLAAGTARDPAQAQMSDTGLAERVGCYVAELVPALREQVAAGKPPLLVINDSPSGPLRYDRQRCTRLKGSADDIGGVRLLRPSAARDVYGVEGKYGAVLIDYLGHSR